MIKILAKIGVLFAFSSLPTPLLLQQQSLISAPKSYDGNNTTIPLKAMMATMPLCYDGNNVKSYHGNNTGNRLIYCEADLATAIILFQIFGNLYPIYNCRHMKKKHHSYLNNFQGPRVLSQVHQMEQP